MLAQPSLMEQAYAIFANVIEFDQRVHRPHSPQNTQSSLQQPQGRP